MKKRIKMLFFFISIILISSVVSAFYTESFSGKAVAVMKVPIFQVGKSVITESKIDNSDENNRAEYVFNVLNYFNDIDFVSEIEFEYTIKIIPSTTNFPVKYKLINLEENRELLLNSELESEVLTIGTEKTNFHYKVVVIWDEENNNQNLEDNLNVDIEVKGVQKNND